MTRQTYSQGWEDAIAFLKYKPPTQKKFKPPRINIYSPIAKAYTNSVDKVDMATISKDQKLKNIMSSKVKRYGLPLILETITFFGKWIDESPSYREEGNKYKGIKHFFLFKLDEMVKVKSRRDAKAPKYQEINDEQQRLVDPFA